MTTDFRRRIRESLADRNLQTALDNNADRRRQARSQGFASLHDAETARGEARASRQAVLSRLPALVDEFSARARAHGMTVHHAADAAQACQVVLDIARARHARLVAKSKSMLSEEIGLNPRLESAGMRVVETDLGEFIVQLRGEPPAHIITPAIHLRREDVARTFVEHLGMAYTTDVAAMTALARRVLRQVFLTSDIGISGANFGVAETGTMCLVTNEGNGRMVTTIPSVHIALVGIERLVPRLADLGPLLSLLPRSATGQRISSYVSLIQAPRAAADADGPAERHVILVDNGRRVVAEGPLAESLLCIRCGACLNVCPVYQEAGGHAYASPYPGPIGSVISPGLFGLAAYGHLAKASSLCGACKETCPVSIDLPALLLRVRGMSAEGGLQSRLTEWALRAFAWASARADRFHRLQALGAWAFGLLPLRDSWAHRLPPPLSAWTAARDFPRLARAPFHARWHELLRQPAGTSASTHPPLLARPLPPQAAGDLLPPTPTPVSKDDMTAAFCMRLEEAGGEVRTCSPDDAPAVVREILEDLGVRSVVMASDARPLLPGLSPTLEGRGMQCLAASLAAAGDARVDMLARLDAAEAGVCVAAGALADTGTVIVGSGPEGGLVSSLLPPACIVLLPSDRLHAGLSAWLADKGAQQVASHASLALITGPSRTADIEMTLTMGVHGPGRLIVVWIEAG